MMNIKCSLWDHLEEIRYRTENVLWVKLSLCVPQKEKWVKTLSAEGTFKEVSEALGDAVLDDEKLISTIWFDDGSWSSFSNRDKRWEHFLRPELPEKYLESYKDEILEMYDSEMNRVITELENFLRREK